MRKKLLVSAFVVLIAALICGCNALQQAGRTSGTGDLITVLNPAIASKLAERVPLAPRISTLEGKTIYLVDIQWGGPDAAYSVFEEIQGWFSRNMPGVKVVLKRTASSMFADDPGLRKEIRDKKVDAVLIGIAG